MERMLAMLCETGNVLVCYAGWDRHLLSGVPFLVEVMRRELLPLGVVSLIIFRFLSMYLLLSCVVGSSVCSVAINTHFGISKVMDVMYLSNSHHSA